MWPVGRRWLGYRFADPRRTLAVCRRRTVQRTANAIALSGHFFQRFFAATPKKPRAWFVFDRVIHRYGSAVLSYLIQQSRRLLAAATLASIVSGACSVLMLR